MVLVFWDTNQNCSPALLWPLDTLTAQVSIGIQRDLLQWPRELFLTGLTREISNWQDRPIQPARVANQNIPLHYFRWLRSSRMNFRRLLRVSFTPSVTERVKTTRSQAIAEHARLFHMGVPPPGCNEFLLILATLKVISYTYTGPLYY